MERFSVWEGPRRKVATCFGVALTHFLSTLGRDLNLLTWSFVMRGLGLGVFSGTGGCLLSVLVKTRALGNDIFRLELKWSHQLQHLPNTQMFGLMAAGSRTRFRIGFFLGDNLERHGSGGSGVTWIFCASGRQMMLWKMLVIWLCSWSCAVCSAS